jgi:uncharacterized BrkB/YihY/UPF0761 family membrane protein
MAADEGTPAPAAPPGPPLEPNEGTETREASRRGLRDRRAAVVAKVVDTRDRLESARPRSRTIDAAFLAARRDIDVGGGVLAGAVAFRLFLFMVPFVFFFVIGLGFADDAANESPGEMAQKAGIGGLVAHAVAGASAQSETARIVTIAVAGFATFFGARGALKVIRIVHALVWKVPIPRAQHKSRSALVFIVVVGLSVVISAAIGNVGRGSLITALIAETLFLAVPFGLWLLISWYMPRAPGTPWTALVPGSLLVAVGTQAMHIVTVYWIAREVSHKSDTYGAIGSALAILFWAYLLGRLMIASVVLNAAVWSQRSATG